MILFVSGRTDIAAFYSKWFLKRYEEGFVDTRNPFRPTLVSRIYFDDVEAILFCTKNPIPILDNLKKIDKPMVFQITITPYKEDIEPGVPPKSAIIEAVKRLAKIIPPEQIFVRYDPIFLNEKYTLKYHCKAFSKLCSLLSGSVKHIIISFLDDYKNVRKNQSALQYKSFEDTDYEQIGKSFSKSARKYDMTVQTCFEERDLSEYGFLKDACFSSELAFALTGKNYKLWKARKCGCVELVDIGMYNSCKHFCKYCYANYDERKVSFHYTLHDENSSLLVGHLKEEDHIVRRK